MSSHEPTAVHILHQQQTLVQQLIKTGHIASPAVKAAFLAIPRHLFVPHASIEQAYQDAVIPTKFAGNEAISSSSQPAIMAIMLEQLALQPGHHVLEVGAGTGFNAALMAHLVGPDGHVTTIDIDQDIVDEAATHLAAANVDNVTVICGDGTAGYAANGPYDRIILTVGGWDIAPAWWAQLAPNGRLLLPLSLNGPQLSVAFDRANDRDSDHLESQSVRPCGFMRLRGDHAEPTQQIDLSPEAMLIGQAGLAEVDKTAVLGWLANPPQQQPTGFTVTNGEMWGSFALWLALHATNVCSLNAWETAVGHYPALFTHGGKQPSQRSYGLISEAGLALLQRSPQQKKRGSPFPLWICGFGETAVMAELSQQLQAWHDAGRPTAEQLHITAYPATATPPHEAGQLAIKRSATTFIINITA